MYVYFYGSYVITCTKCVDSSYVPSLHPEVNKEATSLSFVRLREGAGHKINSPSYRMYIVTALQSPRKDSKRPVSDQPFTEIHHILCLHLGIFNSQANKNIIKTLLLVL